MMSETSLMLGWRIQKGRRDALIEDLQDNNFGQNLRVLILSK
jgi:hypothetical protein